MSQDPLILASFLGLYTVVVIAVFTVVMVKFFTPLEPKGRRAVRMVAAERQAVLPAQHGPPREQAPAVNDVRVEPAPLVQARPVPRLAAIPGTAVAEPFSRRTTPRPRSKSRAHSQGPAFQAAPSPGEGSSSSSLKRQPGQGRVRRIRFQGGPVIKTPSSRAGTPVSARFRSPYDGGSEAGSPYHKRTSSRKVAPRVRKNQGSGRDSTPAVEAEKVVKTSWFEAEEISDELIDSPPDLTGESDLEIGDLFYHRTPSEFQLWLWTTGRDNDDDGAPFWKPVTAGYARADGRRLTVTPALRKPSWVTSDYYFRSL
ncbi:hypothetical protein BV20DRAFT_1057371 [Pilatotrama ljubarskyi]|nr:hypothetical protein BV20DRAFT_1057371 [Pilatotrama ljubarskyi]